LRSPITSRLEHRLVPKPSLLSSIPMLSVRNNQPARGSLLNPSLLAKAAKLLLQYGPSAVKAGRQAGAAVRGAFGGSTPSAMSERLKSSRVSAPAISGVVSKSSFRLPSFSIPFSCALVQVSTGASTGTVTFQACGTGAGTGAINVGISPYQAASTAFFPVCFPPEIIRVAQSFSRYRLKPGGTKLSYRGAVPTNTQGSLAIEVLPAEYPTNTQPTFQGASAGECSMITPPWASNVPFAPQGLERCITTGPEWKYCDFDGSVGQPECRQDLLLLLSGAHLGCPVSTILGYLFMEGTLEFKHLQDTVTVVNARKKALELAQLAPPPSRASKHRPLPLLRLLMCTYSGKPGSSPHHLEH